MEYSGMMAATISVNGLSDIPEPACRQTGFIEGSGEPDTSNVDKNY